MNKINIDDDIKKASTLPGDFYANPTIFEHVREKIFVKSWQYAGDTKDIQLNEHVCPFMLLPGFLNEPLLLTRDSNDRIHCLSNVCTHRGNLVAEHPGHNKQLKCRYHGRRFKLDGTFEHMPEFKETENFPSPSDSLPKVPFVNWSQFIFVSINPLFEFQSVIDNMNERLSWLPISQFKYDATRSKDYLVNANWALYCDNYLEGFHIPFIHPDLNKSLDYKTYQTQIYKYCNLQIGHGSSGTDCFDIPSSHPDYGKEIAAYYYWIFPNMMFNFYPWGLSINIVKPLSVNLSKVSFLTYVMDESKLHHGAGALLDKVEREDESVVESVQLGIKSRLYKKGRYSPKKEQGVHHFHTLIAEFLAK